MYIYIYAHTQVASEPRTLSIMDIKDVPQHVKAEIQQFFELYKSLEAKPGKPKWVKIRSWGDKQKALAQLSESIKLFNRCVCLCVDVFLCMFDVCVDKLFSSVCSCM